MYEVYKLGILQKKISFWKIIRQLISFMFLENLYCIQIEMAKSCENPYNDHFAEKKAFIPL